MKNSKKLAALALAVLMAFSAAGCTKSGKTVAAAEDLPGATVGVQSGTTGETYCQEDVENVNVKSYKSGMDAALDLKSGRLDAVVLDELPARDIVKQNPDLKILEKELTQEEYAIAVKKGNTELLDSINKTLKRMKSDGSFDKLGAAFMPADGEIKIPEMTPATGGKSLTMATNAAFKPFEYVDGTEVVGFDICLSNEIAKDFGAQLSVSNQDFDSLIAALQAGKVDFVAAGMSATNDRKQSVDFSDSYFTATQVIIVKK